MMGYEVDAMTEEWAEGRRKERAMRDDGGREFLRRKTIGWACQYCGAVYENHDNKIKCEELHEERAAQIEKDAYAALED